MEDINIALQANQRLIVTVAQADPSPAPLLAPLNLTAAEQPDGSVLLTWTQTTLDADSVQIEMKPTRGSDPFSLVDTVSASSNQATLAGSLFTNNWEYSFRVRYVRGQEQSAYSNTYILHYKPGQAPGSGGEPPPVEVPSGAIEVTNEGEFWSKVAQARNANKALYINGVTFTKPIGYDPNVDGGAGKPCNWYFNNCVFRGPKLSGEWWSNRAFFLRHCRNVYIMNSRFEDFEWEAITGYHLTNFQVINCVFDKIQGDAIHIAPGAYGIVVKGCLFRRVHRMAVELQYQGTWALIEDNWVDQHDRPYYDSFGFSIVAEFSERTIIRNNTLLADSPNNPNAADGIDPRLPQYAGQLGRYGYAIEAGGADTIVENNYIWGPWVAGVSCLNPHTRPGGWAVVTVRNNEFYGISTKWGASTEIINDGGARIIRGNNVISKSLPEKPVYPGDQ